MKIQFEPFPMQKELIDAGQFYRHRIAKCGRRAGKTAVGAVDTLINGAFKYGSPTSTGVIGEPTYGMVENIVMPYIEELWPPQIIQKVRRKDHAIDIILPPSKEIPWYRGKEPHDGGIHTVNFASYTHPNHFRGIPKIAYFWLDEIAMADKEVWKILNYGISDLVAPGLFTTTPKFELGTLWFKEMCDRATEMMKMPGYSQDEWIKMNDKGKAKVLEEWVAFELNLKTDFIGNDGAALPPVKIPWAFRHYLIGWTSMDNPHLPVEERVRVEYEAKMDEDFYRQEILGEFVEGGKFIFGDLNFEMYDENDHRNYNLETYLTIDPAYTEKDIEDRSQTAMSVIGVSPERDLFILENVAGYWSASKQVDMMFLLQDKYNCRKVGVEKNAAYIYLEKLVAERQKSSGIVFDMIPIQTYNEQKVARAQVVPPFIKNTMLKFPKTRDGSELVNQMKTFPLGRWTDRVDSVVLFFSRDMEIIEGLQKEMYVPEEHDPDFMPLMTQKQIQAIEGETDEFQSLRLA